MRTIEKVRLAISYYCDLNCKHCYVPQNLRKHYDAIMSDELQLETINSTIDFLKDNYGLKKLDITGGEALLSRVWPRTQVVVGHALNQGLEVQINTTGSGDISPAVIRQAFGSNISHLLLHVSLDGIDPKYVDAFRGRKGAFDASIHFMKTALDEGIRVRTRLTITSENVDQVLASYQFVSSIGVTSFMCKPVNIAGNSLKNNLVSLNDNMLRSVQLDLLNESVENKTELHLPAPLKITIDDIPENANVTVFNCLCGSHLVYIAYNGDIFPCTYMAGMKNATEYVIGNIKDGMLAFTKVWEDENTYKEFRTAKRQICTAHELTNQQACK